MALRPFGLTKQSVVGRTYHLGGLFKSHGPTICWTRGASCTANKLPLAQRNTATHVMTKWAEEVSTTSSINTTSGLSVCSHFDSGNIDVVELSDPLNVQLRIHPDPFCEEENKEHFQWFYYRIAGVRNQQLCMNIVNAGASSYPHGWPGYRVCASYDRSEWFRVDTSYDETTGVLSINHRPTRDAVYYAYFAPYTYDRHLSLVAEMQADELVQLEVLGHTHDGHDVELLRIGEPSPEKAKIWVIARQHPGESMAEWFVEGLLKRLLDRDEALSRKLVRDAVFYVVPNMCPDGSWRGHLRTNADGVNLNRAWAEPTDVDKAPEVFYVKRKMDEVGVDMFVDVHGDETVCANFIHGNEGIPSWDDKLSGLQSMFSSAFHRICPTFSPIDNYAVDAPGTANLAIAARQIGERFKCLAFTIEMPFKDTLELPDPVHGFSDKRALRLGAAALNPIAEVIPHLR